MTPVSPLHIISAGNLNHLRFQLMRDVAEEGKVRKFFSYFIPSGRCQHQYVISFVVYAHTHG